MYISLRHGHHRFQVPTLHCEAEIPSSFAAAHSCSLKHPIHYTLAWLLTHSCFVIKHMFAGSTIKKSLSEEILIISMEDNLMIHLLQTKSSIAELQLHN